MAVKSKYNVYKNGKFIYAHNTHAASITSTTFVITIAQWHSVEYLGSMGFITVNPPAEPEGVTQRERLAD